MPKQVRLRRGTTAQHGAFTGAEGEATFDTTKKVIVLHDGVTPGGKAIDGYVRLAGSPVDVQTIETGIELTGGVAEDERALVVNNDVWFKSKLFIGAGQKAQDWRKEQVGAFDQPKMLQARHDHGFSACDF